jgi:hypothetical protein
MGGRGPVLGHVAAVRGGRITAVLTGGADGPTVAVGSGALVALPTAVATVYGQIGDLWFADPAAAGGSAPRMAEIDILGEVAATGAEETFRCGASSTPTLGGPVCAATAEDLELVYARPRQSRVPVGTLHQDRRLPAYLVTDSLLGKHFAIAGTTGSGKSCAVALILHAILADHPNGHVVMLDPHGEYGAAFGDKAEVIGPGSLHLPYWLMNFEEVTAAFASADGPQRSVEAAILRDAVIEARRGYVGRDEVQAHITVDSPIPFSLAELERLLQVAMGRLEKPEGLAPYLRLKARIHAMANDRRFAFMFPGMVVRDVMTEILGRVLRLPVGGRPVTIIDLSGVPSEIVDIVVSMLCRMIFDFALWKADAMAAPMLLVCEEAHRYVPEDERLGFEPTRRAIARIAREGRKHGVSLCLVTQRPSEIATTILSQCNTLFALRLANERDHAVVRAALPDGTPGLLAALPTLQAQEAVAVGEGVTVPMRLRFADLPQDRRPRGAMASFSTAWQHDRLGAEFVRTTLEAWRRQRRQGAPAPLASA